MFFLVKHYFQTRLRAAKGVGTVYSTTSRGNSHKVSFERAQKYSQREIEVIVIYFFHLLRVFAAATKLGDEFFPNLKQDENLF